jgi:hypothetical protein
MVHALRHVHRVLAEDGCLVDIRPVDERAEFIVRGPRGADHAGWLAETDEGIEYCRAEDALHAVVGSGLFRIDVERTFTYSHHARSLEELRAHLAATWTDAVILPRVAERVETFMAAGGGSANLVLRETAWMRVLRKDGRPPAAGGPGRGRTRAARRQPSRES